jgi:carbon-monoxide dehydrogenase medium subunit
MIWKEFTYLAPTTLGEALSLLAKHGQEARVLAGGTDLLLRIKTGQWRPRCVVNIKRIPGLAAIDFDPDSGLRLGALVTAADLVRSEIVQAHYPALAQGAAMMASMQIRNLATVGGNLCNAAPSADLAPPLIALRGAAVIAGPEGQRRVPLDEFFLGPGQTVLARDELLVAITLPFPRPGSAAIYLKNSPRQAMDIAVVGVAVAITRFDGPASNSRCEDVRVVLGAVAPTPLRARRAEALLQGQALTKERVAEAAHTAAQVAQPIDDVRGSVWYRRRMVEVLTRRALLQLAEGSMAQ